VAFAEISLDMIGGAIVYISLEDRVVVITGASRGIGRAAALEMARAKARLVLIGRDTTALDEVVQETRELGAKAHGYCMDVREYATVPAMVDWILRKFGTIDVLVNNAGTAEGGAVEEIPVPLWRRVMETNFFGPLACIRAAVPGMREQGSGAILNVTSINGRVSGAGGGPYAASKFALEALAEALRFEMLPFGVTVVVIQPGLYKTAIWGRQYGVNPDPRSPYAALNRDMAEFFEQGWRNPAVADPAEVGQLVCAILREDHPTLRYPVGRVGDGMSAKDLIDFWIQRPWEEVEARHRDE